MPKASQKTRLREGKSKRKVTRNIPTRRKWKIVVLDYLIETIKKGFQIEVNEMSINP